jgi:hypothetical protein
MDENAMEIHRIYVLQNTTVKSGTVIYRSGTEIAQQTQVEYLVGSLGRELPSAWILY